MKTEKLGSKEFPKFNEDEARRGSQEAIQNHVNDAKEYNPSNILKDSRSFDEALKRAEEMME